MVCRLGEEGEVKGKKRADRGGHGKERGRRKVRAAGKYCSLEIIPSFSSTRQTNCSFSEKDALVTDTV